MPDFVAINLNGKRLSKEQVLTNWQSPDLAEFGEEGSRVLSFYGRWLSGERAFAIRTSGSTGPPKTIELTREQMQVSVQMTARALDLQSGDRALLCLSTKYIGGLMMLVRSLELGLDLTVVDPVGNPFEAFDLKSTPGFDFTALVPVQLQKTLEAKGAELSVLNEMKAILVGGAPLTVRLERCLNNLEAPAYQTFGMTETASHIALRRLNGQDKSEFYQVLPGVEIGQDTRGCLTIKSGLTRNEWLVTNDLVDLISQNEFKWLGRIDNVINSGGVKVYAEKVESAVAEELTELGEPQERAFFVTGVPDDKLGELVVCVFEGAQLPTTVVKGLSAGLTDKLEKYEVPKRFLMLDKFVRTSTTKIDRRLSLMRLLSGSAAS